MKPWEHVAWELVLVLSSVFVFRSLWMLMDRVDVLNRSITLVLMLGIGIALTIPSIYKLTHKE